MPAADGVVDNPVACAFVVVDDVLCETVTEAANDEDTNVWSSVTIGALPTAVAVLVVVVAMAVVVCMDVAAAASESVNVVVVDSCAAAVVVVIKDADVV